MSTDATEEMNSRRVRIRRRDYEAPFPTKSLVRAGLANKGLNVDSIIIVGVARTPYTVHIVSP